MGLDVEYEKLNVKQRHKVMQYINEYDHFDTLYNENIINKGLVRKIRKSTIISAYKRCAGFISSWRKNIDKDAWVNLEKCFNQIK